MNNFDQKFTDLLNHPWAGPVVVIAALLILWLIGE